MRSFASAVCLLVLLLCVSSAASAANFAVQVGGNAGLVFTPSTLTINAGDTVTFTNAGGFHNVADDGGAFRCADDCTTNGGNPNSDAWSSTVTYPAAGTFGFHCEIHGAPGMGMAGTVTVNAAPPPPPPVAPTIGGGLSGNWYNTSQAGIGFQIEVTSNADQMLVYWFAFTPDGTASQWIYGQGTYDPTKSTITMPAEIITGGAFPFPASNFVAGNLDHVSWGTLTFTFTDCNNANLSWDSTVMGYGSGSMPITRLTTIAGTTCP